MQWYLHLFKVQKKFKVRLKSSRNCSVCVRITFDQMESSFSRFNHVCFLISALDRSSKASSWVGSSFSISSAIPFSKHHFFQSGDQKAVLFTVFSLFKLFFSRGGESNYLKRRPLFRSQIFKFSNFVATSKARIWLAICEFLWLLTNQTVWFVSFFALN